MFSWKTFEPNAASVPRQEPAGSFVMRVQRGCDTLQPAPTDKPLKALFHSSAGLPSCLRCTLPVSKVIWGKG